MCRELRISDQSYYRWRKEYGGMQVGIILLLGNISDMLEEHIKSRVA